MDRKQEEIEKFTVESEMFYCEKFNCKMLKTACETRRNRHGTMFKFGFKFVRDYGCGGCEQWKKM